MSGSHSYTVSTSAQAVKLHSPLPPSTAPNMQQVVDRCKWNGTKMNQFIKAWGSRMPLCTGHDLEKIKWCIYRKVEDF